MPTIVAHTRQYPPHRWIGAELATHELLKYLAGQGWNVLVRVSEGYNMGMPANHTYEHEGVHVTNDFLHHLPAADVVLHMTMSFDYAKQHAHRDGALQVQWLHGGWESHLVQQVGLAEPDLVVFNSESQRRGISHLIDRPSTVLHPPVWPPMGVGVRCPPLLGGKVTLINTTEGKGANIFYDLAAYMPMTEFLAVGGGHGQQIDPPDLPNLEFRPHGTDMAKVWRDTAVLLMPSTTESWGMVAVEAIHRGIPVIGMDIPGLSECIAGMPLVQMQDCVYGPQAWAAVLRNVLADWDHWSTRALARSEQLNPGPELEAFDRALYKHMSARKLGVPVEAI